MLTIDNIREAVAPLAEKYDIAKVYLFGSYAGGNTTEKSDVDFLVLFNTKVPSIFKVMGFKEELEQCLRYSVDIVTLPLARPDKLIVDKVVNVYERA